MRSYLFSILLLSLFFTDCIAQNRLLNDLKINTSSYSYIFSLSPKSVDSSMIIGQTPPNLLKLKSLTLSKTDSLMMLAKTPTHLLKNKSLTEVQIDSTMILKETPKQLLKPKSD